MKKIFTLGSLLFFVAAMASIARADSSIGTVSLMLPGSPIGDAVTVTPVGGSGEATDAGPYTYDLSDPSTALVGMDLGLAFPSNGATVTKSGFCIALTIDIYEGVTYSGFKVEPAAVSPTLSASQLNNIIQLMDAYNAAGGSLTSPTYNTSISDALSIAIWESLNGTGHDGTSSGYQVNYAGESSPSAADITVSWGSSSTPAVDSTSYAVYLANKWLGALTSAPASLPSGDFLFALDGSSATAPGYPTPVQNQSIVLALGSSQMNNSVGTPEPKDAKSLCDLVILGLAAGIVVAFRRRSGVASAHSD